MAEALAVAASVTAIIQITDRIIGVCKSYITSVRDAPADLRVILLEISVLKAVFENLEFLIAGNGPCSTIISSLYGADGPVNGCRRSVHELEGLFPLDSAQIKEQDRSKKMKLKSTLTSLAWPLKETKARKLLDEILRYKTTITLALTTESIHDIKDTKARAFEIHAMMTESQRQEVYRWLHHTDPSSNHHRAQKNYEPGTGDWMLRSPEWADWLEAKNRCLWIHGIPGAGKTVLMSHLIEQIKESRNHSPQRGITCVYYYCYFAHNQDETKPFLKWLINQLCREADHVPAILNKLFKHGGEPSLADLLDALASILTRFEIVYSVVDAVDESSPREDLLAVLQDLATESRFTRLQILASSREYIDIERTMEKFSVPVSMNNPYVAMDIRLYVQSIIQSCPQFSRWPRELLLEVEETVVEGAEGMFRWAVCQLDALKRLKCERDVVARALKNLPKTLDETYDRIFTLIPKEEIIFVHHVLRWVAHHNEMYKGDGMPCELLIEAAWASTVELTDERNERFYDKDTLREICGCLIDISPEEHEDIPWVPFGRPYERYDSVTFAHYTVREYIDSARISKMASPTCTAVEGTLKDHLIGMTISEAQNVRSKRSCSEGSTDDSLSCPDLIRLADSNFSDYYYILSSLISLYLWPDRVCQHSVLRKLVVGLLDPSKPHFKCMEMAAQGMDDPDVGVLSPYIFQDAGFWSIKWDPGTSTSAKHLYILLLLYQLSREYAPLLKTFLQQKDHKRLLESRLSCVVEWGMVHFSYREDTFDQEDHEVDGSFFEVFAQPRAPRSVFPLLVEVGAGMFDPSVILLLFIGSHDHKSDCKDYCQIATYRLDFEGVSALLKHEAHPNSTGCSNGIAWEEDTIMSYVNHLHGASPLRLVRKYTSTAHCSSFEMKSLEDARKKVEALLLQYNTEEISSTYDAALDEKCTPGAPFSYIPFKRPQAHTNSLSDDNLSDAGSSKSRSNKSPENGASPAFQTKILNPVTTHHATTNTELTDQSA